MTALFDLPFRSDEMRDPSAVRAIITVARNRRSGHPAEKYMGAFGAVLFCNSQPVWTSWGIAYAESEDIIRAYAILHLLHYHCDGLKLIAMCKGLKDQLSHVTFSSGFKANGHRFDGYEVLKPAQQLMKEGKWELRDWTEASRRGRAIAQDMADVALDIAFNYRPFIDHIVADHPRHFLFETEKGVTDPLYFDEPVRLQEGG